MKHRTTFISYLGIPLGLRHDRQRFDEVWHLLEERWNWPAITDREWSDYVLALDESQSLSNESLSTTNLTNDESISQDQRLAKAVDPISASDTIRDDVLPESLLVAAKKHRLVPLAGPGVSLSVRRFDGQPLLPTWRDLLIDGANRLVRELDADRAHIVEAHTNMGKFPEAAETLKEGLGALFADWIRQAVNRPFSEVSPDSLELPKLLWELGSRILLTTNNDSVLRWACPRVSDLEEWSQIPPISTALDLEIPTVWHLHGSVRNPGNLILSHTDYKNLYEGNSSEANIFRTVLRDVIRGRTLLLVGFCSDDAYLQAELVWFQKFFSLAEGRHYLLIPKNRLVETKHYLTELTNLTIISYGNDATSLLDKLKQLRQAASPIVEMRIEPPRNRDEQGRATLETYLETTQRVNGLLQVPGIEREFPLESVWVEPKFVTSEGETRFHKILASRAVVIEAPAGAGKSTLARFLVTILARDRLKFECPGSTSWQRNYLGVEPGEVTQVPLLLNFRSLDTQHGIYGIFNAASPPIADYERQELEPLLERGEVAFIIDGVDEVPSSDRMDRLQVLLRAKERWKECYFLLTTRPGTFSELRHAGFTRARLAELSQADGARLIQRWASALFSQSPEAETFVDRIRAALTRTHELRPMLSSPLSVAFLCWNYWVSRTLPTNKASLYDKVAGWLIESRSEQRLAAGIDIATTWKMLEVISFLLLRGIGTRGPTAAARIYDILEEASKLLSDTRNNVEKAIRVETSLGSCLEESFGSISFWHINLRDYFAARWLVRCQVATPSDLADGVKTAIWNTAWQECMDIFVGLLVIQHPQLILPFLEAIEHTGGSGLSEQIKRAALRSRVLDLAIAHGYRPPTDFRESLRLEFSNTMGLTDTQLLSMETQDRISAFSTLGALQLDPRLHGKPSTRALVLAPGTSTAMGRYPVTVQEYARFVRANGYEDVRWMFDSRHLFWKYGWRAPLSWEEQKVVPNAPIVGVSWHEAKAYCRWLTQELDGEFIVRLPTRREWSLVLGDLATDEEASRDRNFINQLLTPKAPVGISPEHRGPNGHDDLHGLIWEWLDERTTFSSRHRRVQITSLRHNDYLQPITYNTRGRQRSPVVGFRIVFEKG
jgi:hypothetical protein